MKQEKGYLFMSSAFSKMIVLFLFLSLIMGGFFHQNNALVRAISNEKGNMLEVKVFPAVCDIPTTYRFTFYPQEKHDVGDWIQLTFPPGSALEPPLPLERSKRDKRLEDIIWKIMHANNFPLDPCIALPLLPLIDFLEDESLRIWFNLTININPEEERWNKVSIIIPGSIGITTPSLEGQYTYHLRTQKEVELRNSQKVMIEAISTDKVMLDVAFPYVGYSTSYVMQYSNEGQNLEPMDTIDIFFPGAVSLDISSSPITVNGNRVHSEILSDKHAVRIYLFQEIAAGEQVYLMLHRAMGIKNPSQPGNIQFVLRHNRDNATYATKPVEILDATYPHLDLLIEYPNENGKADFWIHLLFDEKKHPRQGDSYAIDLGISPQTIKGTIQRCTTELSFVFFDQDIFPATFFFSFTLNDQTHVWEYTIEDTEETSQ